MHICTSYRLVVILCTVIAVLRQLRESPKLPRGEGLHFPTGLSYVFSIGLAGGLYIVMLRASLVIPGSSNNHQRKSMGEGKKDPGDAGSRPVGNLSLSRSDALAHTGCLLGWSGEYLPKSGAGWDGRHIVT